MTPLKVLFKHLLVMELRFDAMLYSNIMRAAGSLLLM